MIAKFFGQFLLEHGALTSGQILKAVEHQREFHHKFGAIAARFGYLTLAQINTLHGEQLHKRRPERMGALAAEMGYLTQEQVEEILLRQRNDHLLLGEAIVQLGFMERDALYDCLDEYHRMTLPEDLRLTMDCFPEEPLLLKLCELFTGLFHRTTGHLAKPRIPERLQQIRFSTPVALARMGNRRTPMRVLLEAPESAARAIACNFFGDNTSPEPDLVRSAMEEFLNILCGNFTGIAAQMGKAWDLEAPLTHPADSDLIPLYGDQLILVAFETPEDILHLAFDVGGRNGVETQKEDLR